MHSVGIDLIYVKRFDKLKNNITFLKRVFTDDELEYIKKKNFNNETMAGIFCAKEAFLKSIKKGIDSYSLKDIEIIHNENNAPLILLHNDLFNTYKNCNISLSISHDKDYATAIVLIEII